MKIRPRKIYLAVAALSLCLAPLGCGKKTTDTVPPGAERGGAGADGNNSAPESLSNGGADPDTTSLTEPSTTTGDATGTDAAGNPSTASPK